jgi:hypothetical protein
MKFKKGQRVRIKVDDDPLLAGKTGTVHKVGLFSAALVRMDEKPPRDFVSYAEPNCILLYPEQCEEINDSGTDEGHE